MADEDANEAVESLMARLEALEKCCGAVARALIEHLPHAEPTVIRGFEIFADLARQENRHAEEIVVYERMAQWFRDAAEQRDKHPRTRPKNPR